MGNEILRERVLAKCSNCKYCLFSPLDKNENMICLIQNQRADYEVNYFARDTIIQINEDGSEIELCDRYQPRDDLEISVYYL